MSRYLSSRDLPEVLSLRDLSIWTGIASTELRSRLAATGDVPQPDGAVNGQPFWMTTTVLRWRPLRGVGQVADGTADSFRVDH